MRRQIREIVTNIEPLDIEERNHVARVLEWIDSGAELCRLKAPDYPKTHLVSYFVVVSQDKKSVLLVDHKKARLWLPTGGHVEPGEHPADTVRREILEELSIEADFIFDEPIFVTINETTNSVGSHTDVSLWYVLAGDMTHLYQHDKSEFNSIKWFHFDDIPQKESDPNMSRFRRKLESIPQRGCPDYRPTGSSSTDSQRAR